MKILKYFIAFAVMIFFSVFPIEEYYPGLDALVYENIRFFGLLFAYGIVAISPFIKAMDSLMGKSLFEYNYIICLVTFAFIVLKKYQDAIICMALYGMLYDLTGYMIRSTKKEIISKIEKSTDKVKILIGSTRAEVDINQVEPGMIISVLPGERVPLDGYVTKGIAHVDISSICDEKYNIPVQKGSFVKSGVTVVDEKIEIEVKNDVKSCFTSRLLEHMEMVNDEESRVEDNTFFISVAIMIIISFAAIISIVLAATINRGNFSEWLYRGLSIMLMAGNITIVSTVGITVYMGIVDCFKKGIFIRNKDAFFKMAGTGAIVFDAETASGRFSSKSVMTAKSYGINRFAIISDMKDDEVKRIGSICGIDEKACYGSMTMPDMFERLKSMNDFSPELMFIGDYKTDGVMLSRASIGCAMGLIESNDDYMDFNSASIVALKDDPIPIVENIKTAFKYKKKIDDNMLFAIMFKLLALGLIISGIVPVMIMMCLEILLEIVLLNRKA